MTPAKRGAVSGASAFVCAFAALMAWYALARVISYSFSHFLPCRSISSSFCSRR